MGSVGQLTRTVDALQVLLTQLVDRVSRLEDRIARLESPRASRDTSWDRVTTVHSSSLAAAQPPTTSPSRPSGSEVAVSLPGPAIDPSDQVGRRELAQSLGAFVLRALRGQQLGDSGRSRLNLKSRLYLIFADFSGQPCEPPRVVYSFAEVARICKRGRDLGQSILIGTPSKWEAVEILAAAGFPWLSEYER